jgi:hypothetical protein
MALLSEWKRCILIDLPHIADACRLTRSYQHATP